MVSEGDRIELVHTDDEYTNLVPGDRGTVERIDTDPAAVSPSNRPQRKLWVDWDSGSTLALIVGVDRFRVVTDDE
jgi:hypothetical protein